MGSTVINARTNTVFLFVALSLTGLLKPAYADVCLPQTEDRPKIALVLGGGGLQVELLAWDDPAADASAFDLCVLRSCWNYFEDPDGFLGWVDAASRASRVLNPPRVVRWNAHKGYLRELEVAGVPIIPTAFVERGGTASLADILADRGWDDVVVKPAISAGSYRTRRFGADADERADGTRFLTALVADRDVLVQKYMPAVERSGERALVWIDGEVTHVVTKTARFAGDEESVSEALAPETTELELAERALNCVPNGGSDDLLYARVDMLLDERTGAYCISELELIEPSLFLLQSPGALARFVAAIAARL